MPATPSLIVRHEPKNADAAIDEVRRIMAAIGEPGAIVRETDVPGTLKVIPEGDAHEAQVAVSSLADEAPEVFRSTSGWTVVDAWVHTDIEEIRRAVAAMQRDLGGSSRVAVRPAATSLEQQRIMDAVAPLLRPSQLGNDVTTELRIDIVGDETGIGVVTRSEFFHNRERED